MPLVDGRPLPPAGSRWWPGTWLRLLVWRWRLGGKVEPEERRGYWFWLPIVVTILVIELLGVLSSSFNNAIPWPTISSTIGHLEKRDAGQHFHCIRAGFVDHLQSAFDRAAILKKQPHHRHQPELSRQRREVMANGDHAVDALVRGDIAQPGIIVR